MVLTSHRVKLFNCTGWEQSDDVHAADGLDVGRWKAGSSILILKQDLQP